MKQKLFSFLVISALAFGGCNPDKNRRESSNLSEDDTNVVSRGVADTIVNSDTAIVSSESHK